MNKVEEVADDNSEILIELREALLSTGKVLAQAVTGSTYQQSSIPYESLVYTLNSSMSPDKTFSATGIAQTVSSLLKQGRTLECYGLLQIWLDVNKVRLSASQFSQLIIQWATLEKYVHELLVDHQGHENIIDNSSAPVSPTSPLESPPALVKDDDPKSPSSPGQSNLQVPGHSDSMIRPPSPFPSINTQTGTGSGLDSPTLQRAQSPFAVSPSVKSAMNRFSDTASIASTDTSHLRTWKTRVSPSNSPSSPFEQSKNSNMATYHSIFHSMHLEKKKNKQRNANVDTETTPTGPMATSRKLIYEKHKSREILSSRISEEDVGVRNSMAETLNSTSSSTSSSSEPNLSSDSDSPSTIPSLPISSSISRSLFFKLFSLSESSALTLTYEAYMTTSKQLFKRSDYETAIHVLLTMPDDLWTLDTIKFLIFLYVTKKPKDLISAQKLLDKHVPADPADKYLLWFYYTSLVRDAKWTECIKRYEEARDNAGSMTQIYLDNAIMEVSLMYGEFEFGWSVYEKMKEIDRHTSAIVMTICWKAFFTPDKEKSVGQLSWEAKAWAICGRCQSLDETTRALSERYVIGRLIDIVKESSQKDFSDKKLAGLYALLEKAS